MTRKVQEFSASAALVELEFQERLLRAMTCELDRMREETYLRVQSGCENAEAAKPEATDGERHGGTRAPVVRERDERTPRCLKEK